MATLATVRAEVRDALDEQTAAQWSNDQLNRWINRGLRDLARVTKILRDRDTINVTADTAEYAVPADVLEIEQAYFLPDGSASGGRYIPLTPRQWESMDSIWGQRQNQTGGYPMIYTVWGVSPNLKIRLYPVPESSITGGLILHVIRAPTEHTTDGTAVEIPDTWYDALVDYAEMCALRKDRDPRWQEAFQLYVEKRDNLVLSGDYLNAPREFLMDPWAGPVPRWLADPDY